MPAWPASLPPLPIDVPEEWEENTIRTPMGVGAAKVRRRYTSNVLHLQVSDPPWVLSDTQRIALFDFWRDTLRSGALSFTWERAVASLPGTSTASIVAPPVARIFVPGGFGSFESLYRVALHAEILP